MEITAPLDKKKLQQKKPKQQSWAPKCHQGPWLLPFLFYPPLKVTSRSRMTAGAAAITSASQTGTWRKGCLSALPLPRTSPCISSPTLAAREAENYDLLALYFAWIELDCSSGREYGRWAADQQLPPDPMDTQTSLSPSPLPADGWMLSTGPGWSGSGLPVPFGPHCKACISRFKEKVVLEPTGPLLAIVE